MTFPFEWNYKSLRTEDVDRLASLFAKTVIDFVPCERVRIVPVPLEDYEANGVPSCWAEGVFQVQQKRQPLLGMGEKGNTALFLPVWDGEGIVGVAVLEGGEPALYEASVSWLLERSHVISRELQLLKRCCFDPMTGLFSGSYMHEELALLLAGMDECRRGEPDPEQEEGEDFSLIMLELYPHTRDAERGITYISKGASYLDSLIGRSASLCHFGAGVFGQIWRGVEVGQARKMADALLLRLKRAGFVRAHLGIVSFAAAQTASADEFLELGWKALRVARKRGPFSLSAHISDEEQARHPLRLPLTDVKMRLGRWWRGRERFALVLLRRDGAQGEEVFSKRAGTLVGPDVPFVPLAGGEAYVCLNGADAGQALAWAQGFQEKIKAVGGNTFSMGIALYPCHDFKKAELPLNAGKALLHSEFLGPAAVTIFDGVSMNISGDVCYNEGDLPRALKEYRRGLAMDPKNVNLLNSLGVTYAQMNRSGMAIPYFEQALQVDRKNFMALFNLGFAYLQSNRRQEAVGCFERALAVDGHHFDLLLQLGRLYCESGQYGESISLLEQCGSVGSDEERQNADYGAVLRYLGEAYKAEGKNREAMASLERAVRLNPRDAAALSMLGELYVREGQGNDIALSLCEKAVELDTKQGEYWYRYGLVQWRTGDDRNAAASLKQCLRLARKHVSAALLLAELCLKLGDRRQARRLYSRVLRMVPAHNEAVEALRALSN